MIESPDGSGQETAVFGDDSGFDPQLIAALDEIVIESLPIDPSQFIPGDPLGGGLTPGQTLPRDPGVDSGDGTGIPPGIF